MHLEIVYGSFYIDHLVCNDIDQLYDDYFSLREIMPDWCNTI